MNLSGGASGGVEGNRSALDHATYGGEGVPQTAPGDVKDPAGEASKKADPVKEPTENGIDCEKEWCVPAELSRLPERDAGSIEALLQGIKPWGPGGASIPGGKGGGFALTIFLKLISKTSKSENPHPELDQDRETLANWYYRNNDEDINKGCRRCHLK
tara:strand:- start:1450 stop:1923 length:474 start_codon:yes stop_codon:yes gene_type:complete